MHTAPGLIFSKQRKLAAFGIGLAPCFRAGLAVEPCLHEGNRPAVMLDDIRAREVRAVAGACHGQGLAYAIKLKMSQPIAKVAAIALRPFRAVTHPDADAAPCEEVGLIVAHDALLAEMAHAPACRRVGMGSDGFRRLP